MKRINLGLLRNKILILLFIYPNNLFKMDNSNQNNTITASQLDFFMQLSHDLRTPLNCLMGFLHLLEQTPLTAEQINYVKALQKATQEMNHLIHQKFQVPLDEQKNEAVFQMQEGDFVLAEKKVLLVEDNSVNLLLMQSILQKWKMQITTAENGLKAVQACQEKQFDVILMDIQMPEMDGIAATQLIREKSLNQQTPILALTANALPGYEEECKAANLDDYITKPVLPHRLAKKLKQHLPPQQKKHENNINSASKVTNLDYLQAFSQGDKAFMQEMIATFIQQAEENLPQIQFFLEQQELEKLRKILHKMKPSFSFMGINSLKETIIQAEELAKDSKNIAELAVALQRIQSVCKRAIQELKESV
jgi:CheY-like chemotaxis protein/HPt (histidine-containing phosphotransfer) domain-containing protein